MKTNLYFLRDNKGVLVDKEIIKSFKLARELFKRRYSGSYKIGWYDEIGTRQEKNVRI